MRALLLVAVLAVLAAPLSAQDNAEGGVDARVTSARGDVYIYYKDAPDEAVEAEEDAPLEAGDRVQTGRGANAELSLDGDSVIELGANADFEVESLETSAPSFSLSLGSILAKIKSMAQTGGRLTVRTPTSVASVRGTEFGVDVEDGGDSHVGVFDEGQVAVNDRAGQGEELVMPNQETSVKVGGPPARPGALKRFKARRRRLAHLRKRIQLLAKRWQRLDRAARMTRRRLARARANGASPERRAQIRRRLENLRKHRKQVREKREKLGGKADKIREKLGRPNGGRRHPKNSRRP